MILGNTALTLMPFSFSSSESASVSLTTPALDAAYARGGQACARAGFRMSSSPCTTTSTKRAKLLFKGAWVPLSQRKPAVNLLFTFVAVDVVDRAQELAIDDCRVNPPPRHTVAD